jgi:hypothetical protein
VSIEVEENEEAASSTYGRAMRPRGADSFRKIYRQAVVLMGK